MDGAATGEAAGGQGALAARCVTDPATMARVPARLRGQLAGKTAPPAVPFTGPGEPLEYRTCALLGPLYAKGYR
jgi:hypothetical protein